MAKNSKKPKDESPPFKKEVPVKLKDSDRKAKQERIVDALGEVKATKADMKLVTSEHRSQIRDLDKEVETLREQLAAGTENREVSCVNVKDFRGNVVKTLRVDTREVVETREMTPDERQETFPALPTGEKKKRGRRASGVPEDGVTADVTDAGQFAD